MRRYLIQIVLDALAIALVLLLLPQVDIGNGHSANLFMSLGAGLLFSLVYTFVQPLVLILVGQLLIRTMGLITIAVNTGVFALLIGLSPFAWKIREPMWLWLLVAAVLISLAVTLLDALLGFDQPQLDAEGRGQFIWKWLDRIPGWATQELIENVRVEQTLRTIRSYGLDIALSPTPINHIRSRVETWISGRPSYVDGLSTPVKVRLLLQEMGPTYVKFGQMVSGQMTSLPEEWSAELAGLQNEVPPFAYEHVRATFMQEFGAPPEDLFASFSETPLAAASMAQVHRATLATGEEVAVKVLRPNITAKVNADLRVMAKLAAVLESRFALARHLNLTAMVEEFAVGVRKEMDFTHEAFHARRLAAAMASVPGIHVPRIYGERSSTRVLTMEFVQGTKISDTAAIDQAGLDRRVVLQTLIRAMVKQILIDGFFHSDPHPGNVLIAPQSGVISFLDMGLVGELPQAQRLDLLDLLWSFTNGDTESIATVALRLTKRSGPIDERAFHAEVERLYSQYWEYTTDTPSMGIIVDLLRTVMSKYGLRLGSNLTLAIKAIVQLEDIALVLQPELDWLPLAFEEAKTQVGEQFTVDRVVETVKTRAVRSAKDLLRELPAVQQAGGHWLDQFRRGRFGVELNTDALADSVTHFSQSMRRGTVALILIGMLIGSAIAASQLVTLQGTEWALLPVVAMGVFAGSALLSVVVVLRMLQAERTDKP